MRFPPRDCLLVVEVTSLHIGGMIPTFLSGSTRVLVGIGLLVPVVLIGIPTVVAVGAEREVKSSFNWVTHTLEVERAVQALVSSLLETETGQRGFILTHREEYLEPYNAGRERVGQQMTDLRLLTSDNQSQQTRLEELQPLVREKLKLLAQTIESERQGDRDAATALIDSSRGKMVMDKIRGLLRVMDDEEHRLLWIRQQDMQRQAGRSTTLLWILLVTSGVFAAVLLYLLHRLSRLEPIIRMCANSRTIEYQGEWLSFEDYLRRRFGISTTHGLSPAELEKLKGNWTQSLQAGG